MLTIFQSDIDSYNEHVGQMVGMVIGALLLVGVIVWLINRSRKRVGVAADFNRYMPPRVGGSTVRFQGARPLMQWLITLVLVLTVSSLGYVVAQKVDPNEVGGVVGRTIGGLIVWPLILLIIYGFSRTFRKRYSIHEVINYGLGLNIIIQAVPIFGRLVVFLKQN